MTDESQLPPPEPPPELPPEPPQEPLPQPAAPPARDPFWGYSDLFLFAGLALPCMLVGMMTVKAALWVLHLNLKLKALELVPAQFIGYGMLFAALAFLFRIQYDRPFWASLAWRPAGLPPAVSAVAGIAVAFAVSLAGRLLQTPEQPNPMTDLLTDRASLVLVAIFGITLGPLCEELAFRGFLQPLLIRSLGVVPGILGAAVPFGLLHLQQYGYSWRHAALIMIAGSAFGWMRHWTGSTRASMLMHAAYNAIFFLALFVQRKG